MLSRYICSWFDFPVRAALTNLALTQKQFISLFEALLHVIAGCKFYLEQGRYTWRHNSVLSVFATSLKVVEGSSLYADIPGFPSPSITTGDDLRPDLLLKTKDNCLYILELTIGFETNLSKNAERKRLKYSRLVSDLRSQYKSVTFVNLSMSSLGINANSFLSVLKMCYSLAIVNQQNVFSFLHYLPFQFEQPTTSSVAETNHGATRIYFVFSILFFCLIYNNCYLLFCMYCNSG